jgi:peptidoglycan hydrolase CwlO-like protein
MSKIDNLRNSYNQALAKKKAIEANSQALEQKLANIQQQLQQNRDKVKKLNFFLEKTEKDISDQESGRP